jgi:hypothetical protein
LIWDSISGFKGGAPLLAGRGGRADAGAAGVRECAPPAVVDGGAEDGSGRGERLTGDGELATCGGALATGVGALAVVFEDGPTAPPRAWLPGIAEPPGRSSETERLGSGSGTREGEAGDAETGNFVEAV